MKNTLLALALLASTACASYTAKQTFFKKEISVDCLVSQEEGMIEEQICDHNKDGKPDYWYEAKYEEQEHHKGHTLLYYSRTQVDLNFDGFPDEEVVCIWGYKVREGNNNQKNLDRSWNCKLQRL